jgi:CRISPR-associated protein Csb2
MSSVLCITLRFLDPVPQFHGRGDDGGPEWPPSPLRLFQALVAASAARWRDDLFQSTARPALQWLETIPPSIVAPPVSAESFGFRMYVPNNSGDLMTAAWAHGNTETSMAKFRVEKDVRPTHLRGSEAIHYLFPLTNGVCPHFDVLTAAARCITHLGWGIDMAIGDATVISAESATQLPGELWHPVEGAATTELRIPVHGTLQALVDKYEKFLNRITRDTNGGEWFNPVPPLNAFRVVGYRRATDPTIRPHVVFELRNNDGSFFPYPQRKLIHVAGMVRHMAIERMRASPPGGVGNSTDWVRTYVAGHRDEGSEAHRQFSYLPLPSIGHPHADPAVRRVMVAAPVGDDRLLNHLAMRLSGQTLVPTSITKVAHPPALVRVRGDKIARFYTQPANAWASVTPVILPGHDDHKPAKRRKLIEAALRQSGIEQPCEFESSQFSQFPKSLSAYKYDRNQRPMGYFRPDHLLSQTAMHLTLRFNDDLRVPGPLAIGAGRHCGFGLMAALND